MTDNKSPWYVLADGKQVRVLQNDGHSVSELQRFDAEGHGDPAHDADTSVRHIHSPTSDPHDQAKTHIAKHVAKHLNEAVAGNEVKHFHLAAPAHVLHDIVANLNAQAESAMRSKVSKDLIHIAPGDVASHFADAAG